MTNGLDNDSRLEAALRWCEERKAKRVRKPPFSIDEPKTLCKLRFQVLHRDGFRCQYCGMTPQDGAQLQVDHIHPRAKGGTSHISNLITSCRLCNIGKRAFTLVNSPSRRGRILKIESLA